ncbi:MAG: efflux RND transporter periplasmic adaptor subunit [Lautropia sp.]
MPVHDRTPLDDGDLVNDSRVSYIRRSRRSRGFALNATSRQRARAGLLLSALLLPLAGCDRPEPAPEVEQPRPVRSIVVQPTRIDADWSLAGDVRARTEVRYGFRVGGRLVERPVVVGDRVEPGQLLARLDPKDLAPALDAQRAQQEAARTDLALAQAELKRASQLRAGNFVSDANVERQQAAVDAARARLDAVTAQVSQARNSLGFQLLKADQAGVVTAVEAEAGQVVGVGQTVVRVAQAGDVEVAISIPEQDLARTRTASAWRVSLTGVPGRTWQARLRELSPAADPASRTYPARLTLLGDTSGVALGMSAVATAVGAQAPQIVVPLSALHSRDGITRVWIVDGASGTVKARRIEGGAIVDDGLVVASGLAAGETVVTAGANLLREGQAVRIASAGDASK